MYYKFVKVNPLLNSTSNHEIESLVNKHSEEGWQFYSFVPQQEMNGTYSNTIIFMKQ